MQGTPSMTDPAGRAARQGVPLPSSRRSPTSSAVSDPYATPGGISKSGKVALANAQLDAKSQDISNVGRQADDRAGRAALDPAARGPPRRSAHPAVASARRCRRASSSGSSPRIIILLIAFGSVLAMALPIVVALAGIAVGLPDHRSAHPRLSAAELLDHAGDDDRHRRGHRLRAVRRHPLPPGAAGGPRPRGGGRHRDRHVGPGGAVRRADRHHRPARHARHRPVVHQRPRHRLGGGRGRHRAGRGHPAARGARVRAAPTSTSCSLPWVHDEERRQPRDRSGTAGAASSSATRGRSPSSACGVVLALALPVLSLRLGFVDAGNDPAGTQTRQAYDMLAEGFGPGFNGPFLLAIQVPPGHRPHRRTWPSCRPPIAADPGRRLGHARHHQPGRHHGGHARLPDDRAAGRGHQRSAASTCATTSSPPPPRAPGVKVLRRWLRGRHRRLRQRARPTTAAVHRHRDPAELPAADGRVPLDPRAAQGRDHEPALDRRRLRRGRDDLPVRLGQASSSAWARRARSRPSCRS